jgi:hypothetical protein
MERDFQVNMGIERILIWQKLSVLNRQVSFIHVCGFFASTSFIAGMLIMGIALSSSFLMQLASATAFVCGFMFTYLMWNNTKAVRLLDSDLEETLALLKKRLDD